MPLPITWTTCTAKSWDTGPPQSFLKNSWKSSGSPHYSFKPSYVFFAPDLWGFSSCPPSFLRRSSSPFFPVSGKENFFNNLFVYSWQFSGCKGPPDSLESQKCRNFVVLFNFLRVQIKKRIPRAVEAQGIPRGGRYRTRICDPLHVKHSAPKHAYPLCCNGYKTFENAEFATLFYMCLKNTTAPYSAIASVCLAMQ